MYFVYAGITIILVIAFGAWVLRRTRVDGELKQHGFDTVERSYLQSLADRTGREAKDLLESPEHLSAAVKSNQVWCESGRRKDVLTRVRRRLGWEQEGSFTVEGVENLAVGQDVEIFTMDREARFCARGTVIHKDPFHIVVGTLVEQEASLLSKGMRVQVSFWRQEDAAYVFCSKIIEHRARGLACLILSTPEQLERRQKRIFVRVEGHIVFDFFHVPCDSVVDFMATDEIEERYGLVEGVTQNLSVGGCQVVCDREMKSGDLVSIPLFPPAGGEILARVITASDNPSRPQYGLQFLGLTEEARAAITRKVFELQLLKAKTSTAVEV